MRLRASQATPAPKFEKPTDEEMERSLVRLDRIEAWSAHAYVFQALPGYARSVRQGVVGLFRDGRVVYMETSGMLAARRRAASWWGHLDDLGAPLAAPKVFRAAKVFRAQHVASRSFMINMHGTIRIICFTGLPVDRSRSKVLSAGGVVLESVPHLGTLVQLADIGVSRAYGALHGENAVAAATVWRSVLTGTVSPETLPLWAEVERRPSHVHRLHRRRDTSPGERSPEK
jgi:hypothetical protein